MMAANESRRSWPICWAGPWQVKQWSASTGRTCFSKNSAASALTAAGFAAGGSGAGRPAATTAAEHHAANPNRKPRTRIRVGCSR
jgi:hypothetical protein